MSNRMVILGAGLVLLSLGLNCRWLKSDEQFELLNLASLAGVMGSGSETGTNTGTESGTGTGTDTGTDTGTTTGTETGGEVSLGLLSMKTADLDGNGKLDGILLVFNISISDSSVDASKFVVDGFGALSFSSSTNGDTAGNNTAYFTFSENSDSCGVGGFSGCDTELTPTLAIGADAVAATSGESLAALSATDLTDGAAPVIVYAAGEHMRRRLLLVFSEGVYGASDAISCGADLLVAGAFVYGDVVAAGSGEIGRARV